MENQNEFRKQIETDLRPKILAYGSWRLDLYEDCWHMYRQENMIGAEPYYFVTGKYDADGIAKIQQRLDDLGSGDAYNYFNGFSN